MKKPTILILLVVLALSIFSCVEQKKVEKKYEANWESLQAWECPEWFKDAKFGIFIHWGPYCVPEFGSEWYPRHMYMDSVQWNHTNGKVNKDEPHPVYKFHKENFGDPSEFCYKDFIPMFTGEKFDADEWIALFREAGAKYVVPVAEHHDGFAMYKS
ncbi:MAG: alpha-L-fucosidase, partial [Calditrichaeota bacterium]